MGNQHAKSYKGKIKYAMEFYNNMIQFQINHIKDLEESKRAIEKAIVIKDIELHILIDNYPETQDQIIEQFRSFANQITDDKYRDKLIKQTMATRQGFKEHIESMNKTIQSEKEELVEWKKIRKKIEAVIC